MGCFLACFGSSKGRKSRKQKHKVQPRFQRNASCNNQSTIPFESSKLEKPISSDEKVQDDKAEEKPCLSLNSPKRVTFDSNVKTYEHVLVDESSDFGSKIAKEIKEVNKVKVKDEDLEKPSESESSSEHNSIASSSGSYPPNHRYQNCRESDDELDFEESDLEDEDDDCEGSDNEWDKRKANNGLVEEEVKPIGLIRGVRDDTGKAHPVLSPVENVTQWKEVKAKGTTPFKLQKENFGLQQDEPRISLTSDPGLKQLSFSFGSRGDESKKMYREVAVDASLSNWLSSTETTPVKKNSTVSPSTPERSISQGSNCLMSPEDRPILGALTLEEINKFSASSASPRKSPSKSPDDMPIIGTVGTYWSHAGTTKVSSSATSFKGIPNTTSKYREDKKVNWHFTPFEARLERALNRGSAEA